MLRTLTMIVAAGLIIFSMPAIGFTQTSDKYRVGDKMPDYQLDTQFEAQKFMEKQIGDAKCPLLVQFYSKDEKLKYQVIFPGYELGILPFGIFDYENRTLLIDNRNTNGAHKSDGIIDEVVINPSNRSAYTDHPYCNK